MPQGYLTLLLHAHLPYVRHPEHEVFLEENWLFEAITECYLPLLEVFKRLQQDGLSYRLTLSLSPPLLSMLGDELLQTRYIRHLKRLIKLAESETTRKHADQRTQVLAETYLEHYRHTLDLYQTSYQCDLLTAFRSHQHANGIEIITTAATHGFLPLLRNDPNAARIQLDLASRFHQEHIGEPARGVWLPECGYYPGLEEQLEACGFRYFIVDTHGLYNASEKPWHGTAAPIACPNGVAAFGRDEDSSRQVWSAETGYPGDPWYRDFHKDIGLDRPLETLDDFVAADGSRIQTGIKYFRVTHQGQYKQPYEPNKALERVEAHAQDFIQSRLAAFERVSKGMDRPPVVVAPYDAELFGHWWYEGPMWLEHLIRLVNEQDKLAMISPYDYLLKHPKLQCAQPSASSWGELGYNAYWLNEHNDWIYPHLHSSGKQMARLLEVHGQAVSGGLKCRALQQALRSLLLAQSSDWAFILKSGTSAEYAEKRVRDLLSRFSYLANALDTDNINPEYLHALEQMDAIFPQLDIRPYSSQE